MKKIASFFFVIALISCQSTGNRSKDNADNLQQPQEFSGTYHGLTPCADCPGIEMQVSFSPDSIFYETSEYLERATKFSDTGRWKKSDSLLTVDFSGRDPHQRFFKIINDSAIQMLDGSGVAITGPLAEHYILKKSDTIPTR